MMASYRAGRQSKARNPRTSVTGVTQNAFTVAFAPLKPLKMNRNGESNGRK
jgi:hypothetical protein